MERTRLCSADEVPENTLRRILANGRREILVARIGGHFYALSERCTHRGGPLSEGAMDNGVVTCPWHFAQFDVKTGEAVGPPASEPLEKYEVRMEEGVLYMLAPNPIPT